MAPPSTAALSAPRLDDERRFRSEMGEKTAGEFYAEYPELKPFDNGEGLFAIAENRGVGKSEFIAFGRTLLANRANATDEAAIQAASSKLLSILDGRGAQFARFYLRNVLADNMDKEVVAAGGSRYYLPFLPRGVKVSYQNAFKEATPCQDWNEFTARQDGTLAIVAGQEIFIAKAAPARCLVSTKIVHPAARLDASAQFLVYTITRWCGVSMEEGCSEEGAAERLEPEHPSFFAGSYVFPVHNYLADTGRADHIAGAIFLLNEYLQLRR